MSSQSISFNMMQDQGDELTQNSNVSIGQTIKPLDYSSQTNQWQRNTAKSLEQIDDANRKNYRQKGRRAQKLYIDLKMVEDISKLTGLDEEGRL